MQEEVIGKPQVLVSFCLPLHTPGELACKLLGTVISVSYPLISPQDFTCVLHTGPYDLEARVPYTISPAHCLQKNEALICRTSVAALPASLLILAQTRSPEDEARAHSGVGGWEGDKRIQQLFPQLKENTHALPTSSVGCLEST